jgi:3-dehydroshikimate dehydratase
VEKSQGKPLFGLCTISHREKLLEYVLDLARDLGFGAIEIWGREPHISEKFDENRVAAARKMVEERHLCLCSLGSYVTCGPVRTRPEELVEVDDVLHTARCLRSPVVRIWASDIGSDHADREVFDRTVRDIQGACDRAARLNLTLAAQMHDDTLADTAASCMRLAEKVARDNFRLVFQVSHRDRPESAEQRLTRVLDLVAQVDIHNFSQYATEDGERVRRAPISEGLVDYYPLLEILANHGYRGCYALQFAAREGAAKRESLEQDLAYVRSLFKLMGRSA